MRFAGALLRVGYHQTARTIDLHDIPGLPLASGPISTNSKSRPAPTLPADERRDKPSWRCTQLCGGPAFAILAGAAVSPGGRGVFNGAGY